MTDQIYTTQQIKDILQPVFMNYNVRKAVLFGSYAKGSAEANSDIDILVDSGLKGLRFFGLLEDVSTSLDKNVDLIDITQIKNGSEVDNEIAGSGVLIYGQQG
ncbi:MAG: nucleotidyltransferase domain-containing protein [Oscillospiraceae bacterium]|nr:nucleotidyltransferase domain-containing protein [Oscillospiraceae bacterium]